jgi:hypothetical protein
VSAVLDSDDRIAALVAGFLDLTLPKGEWTHAAHFATALWLLRHRPDLDLPAAMPDLIRTYNRSVGGVNDDRSGYHETITQASLRAAHHALTTEPADQPLHRVLARLIDGPCGRSDWLLAHWSRERLFSVEARRTWSDPDLAPLPF